MPRRLNDLDVFYDPSLQSSFSPAFDEAAAPPISPTETTLISSSSIVSGSIIPVYGLATSSLDTSQIDAHTQGVELTTLSRHDAGFVKIWSGMPGHEMLQTWYGERGPSISAPFTDDEAAYLLDASSIVKTSPSFPILTFPLQAASETTSLNYKTGPHRYRVDQDSVFTTLNGTIEPLAIRLQPAFYNSDVPFTAHIVKGTVGSGNPARDGSQGFDQVVTVDYYNTSLKQTPFVDPAPAVDSYRFVYTLVNGIKTLTSTPLVEGLSAPGVATTVTGSSVGAFVDARYTRNNIAVTSEDSGIINALSLMTGSTDNYVSFDERSATCGWWYDNTVTTGTDSIAFGGMTY